MRRVPLAALALVLLVGACADDGASDPGDDAGGPDRFARVRLEDGAVLVDTGSFALTVETDPVRLEAAVDGEVVVAQPAEGGLFVRREGTAVPVVAAEVQRASEEGLVLAADLADGSAAVLTVDPRGPGGVHLGLAPGAAPGTEAWGLRFAHPADELVYGLSAPASPTTLDRTGSAVTSDVGFHQTSEGYGLLVDGGGPATYDVGVSEPQVLVVQAPLGGEAAPVGGATLFVGATAPEVLLALAEEQEPAVRPVGEVAPNTAEQLAVVVSQLQQDAYLGAVHASLPTGGAAEPPDEVHLRTQQVAAVLPALSQPASLDPRWRAVREALGPYFAPLVEEADTTGLPEVRPLGFRYGDVPEARNRPDVFLVGDDLLVAPVTEPGARSRSVWFPPGTWVSLWDEDELVEGPIDLVVDAPLDRIPLYGRAGSELAALQPDLP